MAGTLDAVRSALNDSGPNFSHAIAVGRQATQRNRAYEAEVAELDRAAQSLERAVVNRDRKIADLDSAVRERDEHIKERDRRVADRDRRVADRDRKLTVVSELLSERDRQVADRDVEIESLKDAVADRNERIGALDQAIFARDSQIDAILGSTSWRITRPLRDLKETLLATRRGTVRFLSRTVYRALGLLWRLVPLGGLRAKAKAPLLRLLPQRFVDRHMAVRSARRYVACSRLQLADRNLDAANGQGDTPILFDPEYYLAANEDVRNDGNDPLRHYLDHGAVEGRLPFSLEPDEIDSAVEALHRTDLREDDAFAFDAAFYRDLHRDLPLSATAPFSNTTVRMAARNPVRGPGANSCARCATTRERFHWISRRPITSRCIRTSGALPRGRRWTHCGTTCVTDGGSPGCIRRAATLRSHLPMQFRSTRLRNCCRKRDPWRCWCTFTIRSCGRNWPGISRTCPRVPTTCTSTWLKRPLHGNLKRAFALLSGSEYPRQRERRP